MLPSKHRLSRKDDFQLVHKNGKFFSVKDFSLLCLANDRVLSRIGVVVGKKFFRKAVDRNKIKRFVRQTMQEELAKIKPGFDIVVHCRLTKMTTHKEISIALKALLKKSNLLT